MGYVENSTIEIRVYEDGNSWLLAWEMEWTRYVNNDN